MMKTREMEVALTGNRTLKFRFPVQASDDHAAERIEEALRLPTLSIKAGDQLYVIPTASIQMITISPAPKKLPRTVIRSATLVSSS